MDVGEQHAPYASTSKHPYSPALSPEDIAATKKLLDSLYNFGKGPEDDPKLSKLLKHTDHVVERDGFNEPYHVTSWKMQDYAYKRDPCPYPTRGRGLFTMGRDRIVARAYDKFFNVDEVSWTKWANLPDLTAPPYYLTLKSNGCIILVAAISPTQLLVTSKHAIGQQTQPGQVSHALVGEIWLDRGLEKAGKTRKDLAKKLWQENWTLVAELCDDSFEEHILPYAPEMTGLHLHGVVYNHPTLLTLPPPEVNKVASEFGFIETAYTILKSVNEVKNFRQSVIDNGGMWNGEHVEGFVVRAALKPGSLDKQPHPNDLNEENWNDERRVFMWKIKFDEPYLMWREWRETTKKILSEKKKAGDDVAQRGKQKLAQLGGKTGFSPQKVKSGKTSLEEAFERARIDGGGKGKSAATIDEVEDEPTQESRKEGSAAISKSNGKGDLSTKLPSSIRAAISKSNGKGDLSTKLPSSIRADRIRNPETRLYAIWVEKYMETNPEAFVDYLDNRGIISVREAFLKWRSTTKEGQEMHSQMTEKATPAAKPKTGAFEKTLIVPVAVPGCGKTAIGVALSELFGFAHTQSDDVKEKKAAKHFEASVAKLLQSNAVVIADKNNHLKQHRQAMVDIAAKDKEKTRLIAVVWPLTKLPHNEIHRICLDRIVARGENHQSLRPVETGEHEIILTRFFGQTDPFDPALNSCDSPFDEIIEMDISWDLEKAFDYVVENLVKIDAEGGGIKGIDGKRPTKDEIQQALVKSKEYKPSVYKEMILEGIDKGKTIRYYGIAVEVDLPTVLENFFAEHAKDLDRITFDKLKEATRLEKRPHVTLVHKTELAAKEGEEGNAKEIAFAKMLWEKCETITKRWGSDSVTVKLTLGPLLCWDSRAMSIQVSKVEYGGISVKPEDMPSDERKDSYHITVGTLNPEIRPIEGKWLLENAMKGETKSKAGEDIAIAEMPTIEVTGRIRGLW